MYGCNRFLKFPSTRSNMSTWNRSIFCRINKVYGAVYPNLCLEVSHKMKEKHRPLDKVSTSPMEYPHGLRWTVVRKKKGLDLKHTLLLYPPHVFTGECYPETTATTAFGNPSRFVYDLLAIRLKKIKFLHPHARCWFEIVKEGNFDKWNKEIARGLWMY